MMTKIFSTAFFLLLLFNSAFGQFSKVKIGTESTGDSALTLKLVARIQSFNAFTGNKTDIYDRFINSPKSALILEKTFNSRPEKKLYINNLEGGTTSVYDITDTFKKVGEIRHSFSAKNAALFKETNFPGYEFRIRKAQPNTFIGKPVEMCLSNNNKYLWVPYYRRDYDKQATEPSALAVIDVDSDKIVRVFPTAPLPKMVASSQDNKYIAVTNWGDNTVHLIDVSSADPAKFQYAFHFVVDYRMNLNFGKTVDRDNYCGLCLRGTVFTPDSNYLFVGRMGGGGIAVFDLKNKKYLGTVFGTKSNVRHLAINGGYLFVSSNNEGIVAKTKWNDLLNYGRAAAWQKNKPYNNWQTAFTGKGARTITLTADGAYLFANANNESKISIVRTADMKTIGSVRADPFPVGMAIDKENKYLVVTAQGRKNKGGNSVMVYEIKRK